MKKTNKKNDIPFGKKRVAIAIAVAMTMVLVFSIPGFAWFFVQRRTAEMYKVESPNSLFLNAAHREDRMYFNLNAVSPYKIDPITGGFMHDNEGKLIPVSKQQYVFSVSGSSTRNYKLQLAHTNNNQFTYTIYPATQYSSTGDIPHETNADNIVEYSMHANSHTENDIQVPGDRYSDSETGMKYYVKGTEVPGSYQNNATTTPIMKASDSGSFYQENYSDMTNVQEYDIPSYWQSNNRTVNTNGKFCDYYILEVTWEKRSTPNLTFEKKETDMVYITAERE